MDQDWQLQKSVTECNKYMLENECGTDVVFYVSQSTGSGTSLTVRKESPHEKQTPAKYGSGKKRRRSKKPELKEESCSDTAPIRICAHKYVLASRSPVFFAMFLGPLAEKGEVKITDVHPEAFKQMLNFLYTDEADITLDNITDVLYVARKYILPLLEKYCEKYFELKLSPENAVALLEQCQQMSETVLIEKCKHIIMFQTEAVLNAESSVDINRNMLKVLLEFTMFSVPEVEIFKFVLKWAERELGSKDIESTPEKIKETIEDLLPLIMFHSMKSVEFAEEVVPTKILDPEQTIDIFRVLCICESKKDPDLGVVARYAAIDEFSETSNWARNYKVINVKKIEMRFELDVKIPHILSGFIISQVTNKGREKRNVSPHVVKDGQAIESSLAITFQSSGEKNSSLYFKESQTLEKGVYSFELKLEIVDSLNNPINADIMLSETEDCTEVPINNCQLCNLFVFCIKELKLDGHQVDDENYLSPVFGAAYEYHPRLLGSEKRSKKK